MKVLSIGNSFSQDAHKWLHGIAESDGFCLDTVNLYIGGCGLETHFKNLSNSEPAYDMEGNGGEFIKNTTLTEAIKGDKYDVVTLQQVSSSSGKFETYLPYITKIFDFVKKYQPCADVYFHKTWSYEIGAEHPSFKDYNCDQRQMYEEICVATDKVSRLLGIKVIPVGDVIQKLREESNSFCYKNGGLSLCRDGFHLSLDYGRFAAAAVWYKTLTGNEANINVFIESRPQFDEALLREIMNFVKKYGTGDVI